MMNELKPCGYIRNIPIFCSGTVPAGEVHVISAGKRHIIYGIKTIKESAIEEIMEQPFFGPLNNENLRD